MSVITLDGIKNQKHRNFIKHISDIFDENRGNIPDDLAFTKFSGMTHTILFNTANPELNGKSLIQFDNDKILFAPVQIQSLMCNDPQNNPTINILTNPKNSNIWNAKSDTNIIKLLINLKDKSPISGFSIRFSDSTRTKYRMTLTLANDDGDVLSQVPVGMDSSWDTNSQQFFQLANQVEGVTKAVMDIELVGQNKDFEWKVNNISLYSNMNLESLKSLSELGVITWSLVQNSVFVKSLEQQGGATADLLKMQSAPSNEEMVLKMPSEFTDHYGSPLPYKPNKEVQYFDDLFTEELVKMSNMSRMYTVTNLPTGDKIYTFETDSKDLIIEFSPLVEMNKYTDEPVVQLDKITKSGMIKKGGFKNYVLTFYIKMDGITMTDQKLLWKYGGYQFNKAIPDLSRAVNVTIPINNKSDDTPHVSTEYTYGILKDMTERLQLKGEFNGLEEGQWVGIQYIRQVDTENKKALQIVRINKNPFNSENNSVNTNNFVDYIRYLDTEYEDHTPAIWGGVKELISVQGSKYVSLYGISLYEVEYSNIE